MLILLFFHNSNSKIILYFLHLEKKVAQMGRNEVLSQKLRFWNKIVGIYADKQVISSVRGDSNVKNKMILIII